jgi:hypothetical protein
MYSKFCFRILDQKNVKKVKFDVISNPMIKKFDVVFVALQFALFVADFMFYSEFYVVFFMPLLTPV